MVGANPKLAFISKNRNAFFLGTEAPDGKIPSIGGETGYADTLQCHCIKFDILGNVTNDRAAMRAQQEFDKAKTALADGNGKMAAYYAGAMTHYIADLSQFCHLMYKDGPWGDDEATLHSRYEEVIDKSMNPADWTSSVLNAYLHPLSVPGNNAHDIAVEVAHFTATGGGTSRNPKWMWGRLTSFRAMGMDTNASKWSAAFRDQTGANVNYAVSGIAQALRTLVK
jgi:hypothetical protein